MKRLIFALFLFCVILIGQDECRAQITSARSIDTLLWYTPFTWTNVFTWTVPTILANVTWGWPCSTGSANQVLTTDGNNPTALSWQFVSTLIGNDYIDNQDAIVQTPGKFNISGNGTVGGNLGAGGNISATGTLYVGSSAQVVSTLQVGGVVTLSNTVATPALSANLTIPMLDYLGNVVVAPSAFSLADGYIPIANSSNNGITWTTITAGAGTRIANGANSITISTVDSTSQDSGEWIENQKNALQTASYRISGSGSVGGNDTVGGSAFVTLSETIHGDLSVATIVDPNVVTGTACAAIGLGNDVSGDYSFAAGSDNSAVNTYTIALGNNAAASGQYAIAIGGNVTSSGSSSVVIGNNSSATGGSSAFGAIVLGSSCTASHENTFMFGDGTAALVDGVNNAWVTRASGGYKLFATGGSTPDLALTEVSSTSTLALGAANALNGSIVFGSSTTNATTTLTTTAPTVNKTQSLQNANGVIALLSGTGGVSGSYTTTGPAGVYKQAGFGNTLTLTSTGRVFYIVCGTMSNSSQNAGGQILLSYGTGTAPTPGSAATGTTPGVAGTDQIITGGVGTTTAAAVVVTVSGIITGLSVGTTYWFDPQVEALVTGVATYSCTVSVIEY